MGVAWRAEGGRDPGLLGVGVSCRPERRDISVSVTIEGGTAGLVALEAGKPEGLRLAGVAPGVVEGEEELLREVLALPRVLQNK